ncbi:MAG: hypothetical protein WD072_05840 [Pirellulales bacterium]
MAAAAGAAWSAARCDLFSRTELADSPWPRKDFIYWTDDGSVAALRYENWKVTFLKQNAHGMHVSVGK